MSEDVKPNPQTLSDEALDQASGGGAQAARTSGVPVAASQKSGDGSVIPGIIAVSGPPTRPGRIKGYEGFPC